MKIWSQVTMLICCFVIEAGAQSFPAKWPQINQWMQDSVTNLSSGGVVTGAVVGGYVQSSGSNRWTIYFPVAGIVTQVTVYTPQGMSLDVSGGILTMSGDPTGPVHVIELEADSILAQGFTKNTGTPQLYWDIGEGYSPIRLRKDASSISIRNSSDTEYRDLYCRELFLEGTGVSASLTENSSAIYALSNRVDAGVALQDEPPFWTIRNNDVILGDSGWVSSGGEMVIGNTSASDQWWKTNALGEVVIR